MTAGMDKPWLVTDTDAGTYGPLTQQGATTVRDQLRAAGRTAEAWAAESPDMRTVQDPAHARALIA